MMESVVDKPLRLMGGGERASRDGRANDEGPWVAIDELWLFYVVYE